VTKIDCEPLYFAGCMGWAHTPQPLRAGLRGVILCAPLGDEALGAYGAWRVLADRLASAGLPVLRFDYPASGDSLFADGELPGLRPWLDCIHQAAALLRERFEVGEIALCGLRMGATLASLASATTGAARLVALAPFANGRAYIRELRAGARMVAAIWQVPAAIEQDNWFEAMGVRWDAQTRHEIEAVDLFRLDERPAEAALLIGPSGKLPGLVELADRWRSLGCVVAVEEGDDLDACLQESTIAATPQATFDRIVAWLTYDAPAESGRMVTSGKTALQPVRVGEAIEQPVHFGPGSRGFGIWCKPATQADANAPTLVILNTTLNPRAGNSRMGVTLARGLAAKGFSSLRIDNIGGGDSILKAGEFIHPYAAENVTRVKAALDWVAERQPGPLALFGLCSGAHAAFHTAVDDVRVRGLVLVNLQKIVWTAGMSLKVMQQGTLRSSYYADRLRKGDVWKRLLRGDVAVRRIGGELARRATTGVVNTLQAHIAPRAFGDTASRRVWGWFDALDRRRVEIAMLVGSHDPARDEVEIYFGAGGRRLRSYPAIELTVLEGVDHSLSTVAMREQVIDQAVATLKSLCPVAPQPRNLVG